VSRADDLTDLIPVSPDPQTTKTSVDTDPTSRSLDELRDRIKALEGVGNKDPDAKQKRLSLSLDIVSRAEQRSDTLRKQLFEMIEKENTLSGRIDQIDNESRPEMIERQVAISGSLRPEELRAMKRKSLELEKANLQALLTEVRRNKASIEQNLQKSDQLVERLRARLEKEIDAALIDENDKP
jgi:septal ring factor EnvC (AmiA/AmiB activator)